MNDNNIENKTETIASRVSKSEKEIIENFIKEYNRKNDTKLTITEFMRTAIFTHMYHLDHSDSIFDVDNYERSIDKINTNLIKVKKIFTDVESRIIELREDVTSLRYHKLIKRINEATKLGKK